MNDAPLNSDARLFVTPADFTWLEPASASFKRVFPHLSLLRRQHSDRVLQARAWNELRSRSVFVLDGMGVHDAHLVDEVLQCLALRLAEKRLIDKFDPARGGLDQYLLGITRNVALECLRFKQGPMARRHPRNHQTGDGDETPHGAQEEPLLHRYARHRMIITRSMAGHRSSDPHQAAERHDLFEFVMKWVRKLPQAQREAVVLRHLVPIKSPETPDAARRNHLNHHRGLKRLRKRAALWQQRQ